MYTGYCSLSILLNSPNEPIKPCALPYAKEAHLIQQGSTGLMFIALWTPEQVSKFLAELEQIAPFSRISNFAIRLRHYFQHSV